jgi:hypothetical protein
MKIECKWHLNEAYWSMTQRRNNMRSQPQWLLSDLFVWCFWNGRHLQDTPADSTKWSRSFSPPNSSQPWRSWRNFSEIPLYFPAQDLHHQHPSTIMDFMIEWIQWFESEIIRICCGYGCETTEIQMQMQLLFHEALNLCQRNASTAISHDQFHPHMVSPEKWSKG